MGKLAGPIFQQVGNPCGRKLGSRNRLSEEVISSFLRDWRKHGDKALEKVRRTQPNHAPWDSRRCRPG